MDGFFREFLHRTFGIKFTSASLFTEMQTQTMGLDIFSVMLNTDVVGNSNVTCEQTSNIGKLLKEVTHFLLLRVQTRL